MTIALAFAAGTAVGFTLGLTYVAAHTKKVDRFFRVETEPLSNVQVVA